MPLGRPFCSLVCTNLELAPRPLIYTLEEDNYHRCRMRLEGQGPAELGREHHVTRIYQQPNRGIGLLLWYR